MIDSSVTDAMKKLVVASLPAAPGPMLGEHGRLDPGFVHDETVNKKLQDDLDDVISNLRIDPAHKNEYAFAVADLTNHPGVPSPAYAGSNDNSYMYIASLAKLLPLYAAYQLRSDLRFLSAEIGSTDLTRLAVEARLRYGSMNASTIALKLPKIETFFTDRGGKINFAFDNKTNVELNLAYNDRAKLRTLKAREHMRLMAGWSDDKAAGLVINAIGFKYLWSLAKRSGLYRSFWNPLTRHDRPNLEPSGLFVGWDYDGKYWGDVPEPHSQEERLWVNTPTQKPSTAGTARSIAYLLTVLAQEKLLNHVDHCGMYEMLRKRPPLGEKIYSPSHAEISPIGIGMSQAPASWTATQIEWNYDEASPNASGPPDFTVPLAVSKIGVEGIDGSNALLVRAKPRPGAVNITAVLVAIDNSSSPDWSVIEQFGQQMALKLNARHP